MKYSHEKKWFCVKRMKDGSPIKNIIIEYSGEFRPPIPDETTIRRWYKKHQEQGSLEDCKRSGRPPVPQETIDRVKETLEEHPELPIRKAGPLLGLKPKAVHHIIKKKLKMKSYKPHRLQSMKPADRLRRVAFCNKFNEIFDNDDALKNVFFSDEAGFSFFYKSNKQNKRRWGTKKPDDFTETYENKTKKITVWASISQDTIIGPYFFEENVNGIDYVEMLETYFLPKIQERGLEQSIFFQHDGASAHYHVDSRAWLDNHFPNRWIGRGSDFDWPARSPDLTPMDFFFWGHIKSLAYRSVPKNVDELKDNIRNAFSEITSDMLKNTFRHLKKCINLCLDEGGNYFENLL